MTSEWSVRSYRTLPVMLGFAAGYVDGCTFVALFGLTETSRFWENHGAYNAVDTANIKTEVIQLPSTCFAEDEGSLTNSARWLQWHWAGGTPPGEAKRDAWIMAQIHLRLKALYQKEGGKLPEPKSGLAL
jgi:anaerobic selenocysteine-containing dehydrogenase